MPRRFSLEGLFALACGAVAAGTAAIAVLLEPFLGRWPGVAVGLLATVPAVFYVARRFAQPIRRTLTAVADGITSLKDDDFSVSIAEQRHDELGAIVRAYNTLGATLRDERQDLLQRELLLDTVIQTTPLALLLTDDAGHVLYSNLAARQLFYGGRKPEGLKLEALLANAPHVLREAYRGRRDVLFSVEMGSEAEVFHLTCREFRLNARPHALYLLKQLTRELAAQEVATWKKVIRVIAHELNNSLAPISSLAHSGHLLAREPDAQQLERVFATIEERAAHLKTFIEGYAQFAKLPKPRVRRVEWAPFLEMLATAMPFRLRTAVPAEPATFDPVQIQQVLINLLKNAHESGSAAEAIELDIARAAPGWQVRVLDRGSGMSDEVLASALLPFYSTKATGTGLGLTLCREVLEAHGGRLTLANRPDGGLAVTLWLPDSPVTS